METTFAKITRFLFAVIILNLFLSGCSGEKRDLSAQKEPDTVAITETSTKTEAPPQIVEDPHSFSKPAEAVVKHLNLNIEVDFDSMKISGMARLHIKNLTDTKKLYLDTRDLNIRQVTLGEEESETTFILGRNRKYLGRALIINITPETEIVNIYYSTIPEAPALQWLDSTRTTGKQKPFLYTQSQAILARTWIPLQDCPCVSITYSATIKTRPGLMVVMSARNPVHKSPTGVYTFEMEQPIPSYLLALAVGDLKFHALDERTGVYADLTIIDAAAKEFEDTGKMIASAEKLYGPYRWERYDILVLPPSFPFGGMENPRLTFVTPTVLAGDKSLTSLIAHELAHSWSGNLVTNATWNDFWLNEGFTTYIERRIMEELYGRDYSEMLAVLGYQDLMNELTDLGSNSPDTRLKLDLKGRDPDDGMTDIAYEKGYFFLRMLEENIGRGKWDDFLRKYFDKFAFGTMTSERFVHYLTANLLGNDQTLVDSLKVKEWIFSTGLPDNCPKPESGQFALVKKQIEAWESGTPARKLNTEDWKTQHWIYFLRNLPPKMNVRQMASLDVAFNFTETKNSEILFEWLLHVIDNQYSRAYPRLEEFLTGMGRRKFLSPLYRHLAKTTEGKEMALRIYEQARPAYHHISHQTIDRILNWRGYAATVSGDSTTN
ncbi:MAG: M1 family metallopeptidase [Calditrichia bacterium]